MVIFCHCAQADRVNEGRPELEMDGFLLAQSLDLLRFDPSSDAIPAL